MTPKILTLIVEANVEKQKENHKLADARNHQLGQYFAVAVGCNLSKEVKYPEKPMFSDFDVLPKGMSEERIKSERLKAHSFFSNITDIIGIKK